jgi:HemY protein
MLRALWFFIQLSVIVAASVWLISQRGAVDIVWNDYTVSVQIGLFLLALALFIILLFTLYRVFLFLADAPGVFSRKRHEKSRKKGYSALTRGFVALAAGDEKKAGALAREVRKLLPGEKGLPLLLEAQAARLRGDEGAARAAFEQLLEDEDAAFLGIRGLLKSSLDAGDAQKALSYARAALDKNPKQPWVLKSVYDLELRNHHWVAAHDILPRLRKYKAIEEDQAGRDEIALLMIRAEEDRIAGLQSGWLHKAERAHKIDPAFAPVTLALGDYYLLQNKKGKVITLVEKAWKISPHPDLAALWARLAPEDRASDPLRSLRWVERLAALSPDHPESHLASARAAMEARLAGEARAHLAMAEKLRATASVFRLRADLEEQTTHSAPAVREWLEKASSAPSDPVWYCTQTGTIYNRWTPIAQPHGLFNTMRWGNPAERFEGKALGARGAGPDPLLIDAV